MRSFPELLAPAGNLDAFKAAVGAGADAIYCGFGNDFNARRSADNFNDETFAAACRLAHLAGTRVYVTVNIVIKQSEMPSVLALIHKASKLGADAFIVQDWGLLRVIKHVFPEVECHMSTQANVHDDRGVVFSAEWGAKRVTTSREVTLPEMEQMTKTGVDIEVFGHGALCFCYSGLCLLSSLSGDRSANRGQCAQPCRLPYKLVDKSGNDLTYKDQTRALCPKDMNTLPDLQELVDAHVASLKIEGRMKAPEYVWSVVSAYRHQLDNLKSDAQSSFDDDMRLLSRVFNRDFTDAYLYGRAGDELMSYERSNNRGEIVGEVLSAKRLPDLKVKRGTANGGRERTRTLTQAEITVKVDSDLGAQDLLEIRPVSDPSQFLTAKVESDAKPGDVIVVKGARPVEAGSVVRVIRSQSALDETQAVLSREFPRLRAVDVSITAHIGEPFAVELTTVDGAFSVCVSGFVVEPARTKAVSADDLIEHVGRMGNTPFYPASFEVDLDEGCGMGFSAVHKVRAQAVELLSQAICEGTIPEPPDLNESLSCIDEVSYQESEQPAAVEPSLCVLVPTPELAQAAFAAGVERVYARREDLDQGLWPEGVMPVLDEVCRSPKRAEIDAYIQEGAHVCAGNISEVAQAQKVGARLEVNSNIPVHNRYAAEFLHECGCEVIWLSPELTLQEIATIAKGAPVQFGITIGGNPRVMTSEHCILQAAHKCCEDCSRCRIRKQEVYLENLQGKKFPVKTGLDGRSRLYADFALDLVPQLANLIEAGVTQFMLDATLMDEAALLGQIKRAQEGLVAVKEHRPLPKSLPGSSTSHLFLGIG